MNNYLLFISVIVLIALLGITGLLKDNTSNITGRPVNTYVNILPGILQPCNFTLPQGWNMVSFFCLGMWNPRDKVLETINDSYEKIFYYSKTDINDPWKSYNPNLPNWTVQQLNYMSRVNGYWIFLNSADDFYYNGSMKTTIMYLYPGWNFVGYGINRSESINASLNGLLHTIVKTYNNSNNEFLIYYYNATTNNFTNTLSEFYPYNAYWINSSATQTWTVSP